MPFTVEPSNVDERSVAGERPQARAERLALAKAFAVSALHPRSVIIGADQETQSLARAWKYLPRMLHPESVVYQQEGDLKSGKWTYRLVTRLEVERLATAANRTQHRRAA